MSFMLIAAVSIGPYLRFCCPSLCSLSIGLIRFPGAGNFVFVPLLFVFSKFQHELADSSP